MSPPPSHGPPDPMIFEPLVVNRDNIAQRTRCILCPRGSVLLAWLRLATCSSASFGQPQLIVRKIQSVIEATSPLERVPGAAQSNRKCERLWTPPIFPSIHEQSTPPFK